MGKFYIAARGNEQGIARARVVRDALVAAGHTWTMDWTIDMERNFAKGIRDTNLSFDGKKTYAALDHDAVKTAEVFIYLEPDEKSEGAAAEFAYADAYDVQTIAVCAGVPRCLFVAWADHIVKTDAEAIDLACTLLERNLTP